MDGFKQCALEVQRTRQDWASNAVISSMGLGPNWGLGAFNLILWSRLALTLEHEIGQ